MSYERRIIGFIDILGFGQLVLDSESDPEKFILIQQVLSKINEVDDMYGSPESFFAHSNYEHLSEDEKDSLNKVYQLMKKKAEPSRVRITTFSDSIVFSCPANTDGLSNFRYFLIKLLVHTSRFKLLLRGGLACGSLVHTDNAIFGPAMNCAYHTESKIARQPRIAVDDTFYFLLHELGENTITNLLKDEVITDQEDSVKFINHLSLATNMVAQNMCRANPYDILANEKNTIEELINSDYKDTKVTSKLDWYVRYFNKYIKDNPEVEVVTLDEMGAPLGTVLVDASELEILDT